MLDFILLIVSNFFNFDSLSSEGEGSFSDPEAWQAIKLAQKTAVTNALKDALSRLAIIRLASGRAVAKVIRPREAPNPPPLLVD